MHVCACMCVYVLVCVLECVNMCACVCACMSAYVPAWLRICVLCRLCRLRKNYEFDGHAILGTVGVACGTILDANVDAKSPLFRAFAYHLHIDTLYR